MAEVKISALTSATTPLAGTETVPIVQGGVTKKVAVSNIGSATWGSITGTLSSQTDLNSALNGKQATLVSGTNIKTINSTSLLGSGNIAISGNPSAVGIQSGGATPVFSSGVSVSKSFTIAANTFASSCVIDFTTRLRRLVGTSGTAYIQVYINTSNSLTGATLIAKSNIVATTDFYLAMQRTFNIHPSGVIYYMNANDTQNSDIINSVNSYSFTSFDVTATNYILIAINNSATDMFEINMAKITQYA